MFYLFLRERETAQAGEGQREKETQNLRQAPCSELEVSTEPEVGLEPINSEIMTSAKVDD